jgi:hypothetical protein
MGLFDKIGEILGDIVDGVVDFVDDVFNIDLKKVLSNDIVKYGLMAVSIFTGGVAIANGVMTGFTQASAAKGFMNKFVEGASGFISGVAKGFTSPLETGGDLIDQAQSALGGKASTQVGQAVGAPSNAQDIVSSIGGDTDIVSMGTGGEGFNAAGDVASQSGGVPSLSSMSAENQAAVSGAQKTLAMDPSQAAREAVTGTSSVPGRPGFQLPSAAEAAGGAAKPNSSVWSRIADGAMNFATSPAGMQTLTGMAQGYAEGAMMQERWDEMQEADRRRTRTWTEGQWAPRAAGSIPSLRESRELIQRRGNQAQARYGY